jgi:hypothetical protein
MTELSRSAVHEAGHVAAAVRCGCFRSARLTPDGAGMTRAVPAAPLQTAVIAAAGPAAEELHFGAASACETDGARYAAALRRVPSARPADLQAWLVAAARLLVRRDAALIALLAEALECAGELTADDVSRLLGREVAA